MKRVTVLMTLIALLLLPAEAAPQEPTSGQPDQTITIDVDLVNVLFSVSDKRGRLYTNLTKDELRVYEDGDLQTITNFSSETDLPLTVALLVDTSGSIRDKLRFEQEAAIEFFYSTLRRKTDQALLIAFDSGVDLLQDFTDNAETLAQAVRKIRAGGGTSLYDAIYLAINEKMAGQPGRKVLIVISDGDDNASRISMTETMEIAQKNDVTLYTISTNSTAHFGTRSQHRGDRTLRTFAEDTGGRAFFPFKLEELAVNFENISEELRSQYTLAYVPTNRARDGSYRVIKVESRNRDYRVKARKGYYAPLDSFPN